MNLSTFQPHLTADTPISLLTKPLDTDVQQLRKWAVRLSLQSEAQQIDQLQKVLTELSVATIDDRQRLTLLSIAMDAANQLIASLRRHYIYEVQAFNDSQLENVAQVKALYYLIIESYDGVVYRQTGFLEGKQLSASNGVWQRYFAYDKYSTVILAQASYQTLLMYQKLLFEAALSYQEPASHLWATVHKLYYLACQQQIVDMDLSSYMTTHGATSIHRLYAQICLHSLLNLRAMRRANILMAQRFLPEWSEHLVLSLEPQSETKVFVDLHSDCPPTYLTAHSAINPYDAHRDCVFIELAPLVAHLKSARDDLIKKGQEGARCRLMNTAAMALSYRYIQPSLTLPIKQDAKQDAQLITGFNDIHYQVSHEQSLSSLINANELPDSQQPRYDTLTKNQALAVETFDGKFNHHNDLLQFRTLLLLPEYAAVSISKKIMRPYSRVMTDNSEIEKSEEEVHPAKRVKNIRRLAEDDKLTSIAPPSLRMMGLFLLCRSHDPDSANWSLGIVRWLNLAQELPKVDWQVLGHQLIACGIRLQDRDSRSRHFVPAFVIGDDEQLQTAGSLIVPTSHFQAGDKVMMRIHSEQKTLRLGRRLLATDEFSQYEVVQS